MKIRIKLVAFLRKDWDTLVEVPDDATNAELAALAEYYNVKLDVDDYVDDTTYCDNKDPEFVRVDDLGTEKVVSTFERGSEAFPELPKAKLGVDKTLVVDMIATALKAHGLQAEGDSDQLSFTHEGHRFLIRSGDILEA